MDDYLPPPTWQQLLWLTRAAFGMTLVVVIALVIELIWRWRK